jgi:hypothetical protein
LILQYLEVSVNVVVRILPSFLPSVESAYRSQRVFRLARHVH